MTICGGQRDAPGTNYTKDELSTRRGAVHSIGWLARMSRNAERTAYSLKRNAGICERSSNSLPLIKCHQPPAFIFSAGINFKPFDLIEWYRPKRTGFEVASG